MAKYYTCRFDGCEEQATAGRFGHTYCDAHNEQVKAEKEQQSERLEEAAPLNLSSEDVQPKRKPRASRGSLAPQIKDAVMMTAAVAAVKDFRVYLAVEATVDEFAVAWDNVAKQSPTARKYIQGMLSGGVWISAFGATLVMVVTTLACTESLPPNLAALGQFAMTKANLTMVPTTPIPEPGPNANSVTVDPEVDPVLH